MRILCSFPGRFGDIAWSLPTCRAIAEANGAQVDFVTSAKYGAITDLIAQQSYIGRAGYDEQWLVQETAPMTPRECPPAPDHRHYDRVVHLGYSGWPSQPLPYEIYHIGAPVRDERIAPLDLDRPWIRGPVAPASVEKPWVSVGFSEEWIELKAGLLAAVAYRFPRVQFQWLRPWAPSRYDEWGSTAQALPENVCMVHSDWRQTAIHMARSQVFLGCCSSLWVLANGLGLPTVIVEPAQQRHHPIFWLTHQRNRLVLGNDGKPSFDARHTGDALQEALGL